MKTLRLAAACVLLCVFAVLAMLFPDWFLNEKQTPPQS